MLTAITTPTFVVILSIMAKYSAKFETVSTLLQAVDVDLQEATKLYSRPFINVRNRP